MRYALLIIIGAILFSCTPEKKSALYIHNDTKLPVSISLHKADKFKTLNLKPNTETEIFAGTGHIINLLQDCMIDSCIVYEEGERNKKKDFLNGASWSKSNYMDKEDHYTYKIK